MAKTLDDIFNDDDFGLLNSKDKSSNVKTDEDRLIDSFEEINSFFEKNGREPSTSTMSEYNLSARLKGFKNDVAKMKLLKPFDKFNLLGHVEMEKKTLNEILADDDLGLLDNDADTSIFNFKHTPKPDKRAETDFVAQRQPISEDEFKKYEVMFRQVHKELKEGRRKIMKFDKFENNLQIGNFYLLDGMLLFLESANVKNELRKLKSGDRLRVDGRTVTIFENATKSNMLFRSLGKSIQDSGKLITQPEDLEPSNVSDDKNLISSDDIQSGLIYILRSKSSNQKIAEISNLYKIGFSTTSVEERIKTAPKEATYLFAEVQIVATYRCYNLNIQHFENLIHRFFGECCLDIDLYSKSGQRIIPREWFVIPLNVINEAIDLLIAGRIFDYQYDRQNQIIKLK